MADRAASTSAGVASGPRSTSSSSDREMQPAESSGGQRLPQELIHRILRLACGPPVISRTTIVGRTDSCTATLLQLSLVSKQLYSFATAGLYAHVRLTTPSSLRAFHRTLTSRAALGRLVNSLHVGADRPLPSDWWPIKSSTDGGLECFKFELTLDCSNNLTARGSVPPPQYDYNMRIGSTPTDAASQALRAAFISASRALDVDPSHSTLDASGYDIGSSVWHVRVFELQAALELYGLEMQRRCEAGAAYPSFRVGAATQAQDRGVFTVTRAQIYGRLMRAGAPTDSFDHPLLYARSGLPWSAEARDNAQHTTPYRTINDEEDPSDAFSLPQTSAKADDPEDAEVTVFPPDLTDALDLAIPTSATVAGKISLARCVIALTPLMRSLSFTGFLESAVLGDRFACALPDLRVFTNGLTSRMWSAWPLYDNPTLMTVEKLNVLDQFVGHTEIDQLFGEGTSLVNLCHLHWTYAQRYDELDPKHLIGTIEHLAGVGEEPAATHAGDQSSDMDLEGEEDEDQEAGNNDEAQSSPERQRTRRSILVDAHLHKLDIDIILGAAPGDRVAAWKEGTPAPGVKRRLKLCPHEGYGGGTAAKEALYDKGRMLWEEEYEGGERR